MAENYFNSLPLRLQIEELGQCRFMESDEFNGVEALRGKKIVIVGCGAQGLNQGLNLRDSGLDVSAVGAAGMSSATSVLSLVRVSGNSGADGVLCEVSRSVACVASLVRAPLNATHSVSSMKDSTAMAPMSNERCKSIISVGGLV